MYNDQTYQPDNFDDENTIQQFVKFETFPLKFDNKDSYINSLQKQTLESEADVQNAIFSPQEKEWYTMVMKEETTTIF